MTRFARAALLASFAAVSACTTPETGLTDNFVRTLPGGGHVIVIRAGIHQDPRHPRFERCSETDTVRSAVKWLLRLGAPVDVVFTDARCAGELHFPVRWAAQEIDWRLDQPVTTTNPASAEPQPGEYSRLGQVRLVVVASPNSRLAGDAGVGEALAYAPAPAGGMRVLAKLGRNDWCPAPCERTALGEHRALQFPGDRPTLIAGRPQGGAAVALGNGGFAKLDSGNLRAVRLNFGDIDPAALAVTSDDRLWIADRRSGAVVLAGDDGTIRRRVAAPGDVAWLSPFENGVLWGRLRGGDLFWVPTMDDRARVLAAAEMPDKWEVALRANGTLLALDVRQATVLVVDPGKASQSLEKMPEAETRWLSSRLIRDRPTIEMMRYGAEEGAVDRAQWLLRGAHGSVPGSPGKSVFYLGSGTTFEYADGKLVQCRRYGHVGNCGVNAGFWAPPFDIATAERQIWMTYPDSPTVELFDSR